MAERRMFSIYHMKHKHVFIKYEDLVMFIKPTQHNEVKTLIIIAHNINTIHNVYGGKDMQGGIVIICSHCGGYNSCRMICGVA